MIGMLTSGVYRKRRKASEPAKRKLARPATDVTVARLLRRRPATSKLLMSVRTLRHQLIAWSFGRLAPLPDWPFKTGAEPVCHSSHPVRRRNASERLNYTQAIGRLASLGVSRESESHRFEKRNKLSTKSSDFTPPVAISISSKRRRSAEAFGSPIVPANPRSRADKAGREESREFIALAKGQSSKGVGQPRSILTKKSRGPGLGIMSIAPPSRDSFLASGTSPTGSGFLDQTPSENLTEHRPSVRISAPRFGIDRDINVAPLRRTQDDISSLQRAGTVVLDGAVLGRWVVTHLEQVLSRPQSGMTGVDPRAARPRSRLSPF